MYTEHLSYSNFEVTVTELGIQIFEKCTKHLSYSYFEVTVTGLKAFFKVFYRQTQLQ